MLLASGATLLILDEPLAGMGPEETARVTALLRTLAADHTVILIEHDIDAIFAAADTLTVLVGGKRDGARRAGGRSATMPPCARPISATARRCARAGRRHDARSCRPRCTRRSSTRYYGQSHILRDVSFRVMPGETVSLLGRNGMGKTTLLRTLMGLLRPARAAHCCSAAIDVTGARTSAIAQRGLAFVPEGRGIFPNLTVEENLTFAQRAAQATERSPWTLRARLRPVSAARRSGAPTGAISSPAASRRCSRSAAR